MVLKLSSVVCIGLLTYHSLVLTKNTQKLVLRKVVNIGKWPTPRQFRAPDWRLRQDRAWCLKAHHLWLDGLLYSRVEPMLQVGGACMRCTKTSWRTNNIWHGVFQLKILPLDINEATNHRYWQTQTPPKTRRQCWQCPKPENKNNFLSR